MAALYQLEVELDDDGSETWRVREESGPEMILLESTDSPTEAATMFAALVTGARVMCASATALPPPLPARRPRAVVTPGRVHITRNGS